MNTLKSFLRWVLGCLLMAGSLCLLIGGWWLMQVLKPYANVAPVLCVVIVGGFIIGEAFLKKDK